MHFKALLAVVLVQQLCWMKHCTAQTLDDLIKQAAAEEGTQNIDGVQGDGTVLTEMDILYTAEDWEEIDRLSRQDRSLLYKRKAIRLAAKRWTNKIVPYRLSNVFSSSDLDQINAAMAEWEHYTCLDFRPASTNDRNHIFLQNGGGCSSYVGMIGGSQPVSLAPGCRYKSVVVHELGHAIGFHHEQTRPDRDTHVIIEDENIVDGMEHNFIKYTTDTVSPHNVPYDYLSVMHYGRTFFSKNGRDTIVTRDPAYQDKIGKAEGLSFRDIKLANIIYSCSAGCSQKTCPNEGFVGKDCTCWCRGSGSTPIVRCEGTGVGDEGECCSSATGAGPHDLDCMREWWVEAGCALGGSHSPDNKPDVQYWHDRTVDEVKADMREFKRLADAGISGYSAKCYGSENCAAKTGKGPHKPDCLREWWLEVGCNLKGSSGPDYKDDVDWWHDRTVEVVKADMREFKRLADEGVGNYPDACYGGECDEEDCDEAEGAGPHNIKCLREWWLEVECSLSGSSAPDNKHDVDWWHDRTVAEVKADMRLYKIYADQGIDDYQRKCYG